MLINEIKRYIRKKSLSQLSKETKIARNTFYSLLRG
nr:MAG TPA: putative dihydroxyacetone kinase regulator [Caudoviricetes sp.]